MRRQFFIATVASLSLLAACGSGTETGTERTRNVVNSVSPGATVMAEEIVASTNTNSWATAPAAPYDYVIVGMGDSFGSGEGNPAKKKEYGRTWRTTRWWNADGSTDPEAAADCHRSSKSGFYKAVRRLKDLYPNINFIYKNFACTGARIRDIYRGGYVPPTEQNTLTSDGWTKDTSYDSQIRQVDEWLEEKMPNRSRAQLDAIYLSIGGNDAGFAAAIKHCIAVRCTVNTDEIETLRDEIYTGLRDGYETINSYITSDRRYANTRHVVISEYPNFIQNELGLWCESDDAPLDMVSSAEWEYLWENIGTPLLRFINQSAQQFGWSVADMANRFRYNVLCDSNSAENAWINNDEYAQNNQGNDMRELQGYVLSMGMVHPNDAGYESYADSISAQLAAQIRRSSTPPGNVTNFRVSRVSETPNSAGFVQMKFSWTPPSQRGTGRAKRSGYQLVLRGDGTSRIQTIDLGEGNTFTTWVDPANYSYLISACGQVLNVSRFRGCGGTATIQGTPPSTQPSGGGRTTTTIVGNRPPLTSSSSTTSTVPRSGTGGGAGSVAGS